MNVLLKTASFSQNMSVGHSSGTPNMRSLYYNAITNSAVRLSAANLDPKVNVSTEFCFLLIHITSAWLQNINMPVCDHLVTLSDA